MLVRTQALRYLAHGNWSTGDEPVERQARWGEAKGGRLVGWVSVLLPDQETRKYTVAHTIVPEDFPTAELAWVELEIEIRPGTKKVRGQEFTVDKFTVVAIHASAEPKAQPIGKAA
jgi:hypothetical protein